VGSRKDWPGRRSRTEAKSKPLKATKKKEKKVFKKWTKVVSEVRLGFYAATIIPGQSVTMLRWYRSFCQLVISSTNSSLKPNSYLRSLARNSQRQRQALGTLDYTTQIEVILIRGNASFCHQMAAWVSDMFYNFYLVKNHKIANNSTSTEPREK